MPRGGVGGNQPGGNGLIASQSGSSLLDTVLVPVRCVLWPSIRTMTLPPSAALWAHYLGICCTKTVTYEEPAAKSPNAIIFWFHECSSIIAFVFLLYLAWNRHSHSMCQTLYFCLHFKSVHQENEVFSPPSHSKQPHNCNKKLSE